MVSVGCATVEDPGEDTGPALSSRCVLAEQATSMRMSWAELFEQAPEDVTLDEVRAALRAHRGRDD